ncbi:MAG: phenylalanine--tRNA ligase subunit beta [Porcipelethomonas sp.]
MNLSMKWLADYIDLGDTDIKQFCHGMTMSGSKVEGYETEGAEISNVVVGKLLSVVPHENSDHLVVCSVDVGKEAPIQIVTGAPNVKEGDIVPVALDGSTLPGGVKIKKGKLRGVESNGMLCSLGELGLNKHDFPYAIEDGIFIIEENCEIGQDIHSAIGLDDTSVEFEITSNRPDCLSVTGLAREASATFRKPLNIPVPSFKGVDGNIDEILSVDVKNNELCKRYCAGIVKNVKIGPSPRWMRERLRASGVRPINNFVDITNYVMLEYGQPMHAFDLRYVKGSSIIVRNAASGEKIVTLDGIERELSEEMLVIADSEKPVAVAGVMGGEYSGIMDDTTTVVFESAYFEPVSVRKTAKKLGMRTDASARYEKGVDPLISMTCLERAFQLVEELGAGEVVRNVIDKDYTDKTLKEVDFSSEWINNFLGTDIAEEKMTEYLNMLGFRVENGKVISPSYRIDIEYKADIAEEVARIYGYNNIPSTQFKGVAEAEYTPEQKFLRKAENAMTALGCYEIATFSFISPKYFDKIKLPADSRLRNTETITNPLGEDTSVMRTTTLPSMLEILSKNYNNRNESAKLFEIGKEYIPTEPDKLPDEPQRLTIGMYGGNIDFYDIKGIADTLLSSLGIRDTEYIRSCESRSFDEKCAFHPGRSAVIVKNGMEIGILGEIHPDVASNYGIGMKVYAAKINLAEIISVAETEISYKPLPKYPATTRDLSLICEDEIPAAEIEKTIKNAAGKLLEKVTLFDVYKGKQIEEGKKSISYSLSMRSHDGTLTDEQADSVMKKVLKALKEIGADLRA